VTSPGDAHFGTAQPGMARWHIVRLTRPPWRASSRDLEGDEGHQFKPNDQVEEDWSGRGESNSHRQFGRLKLCH
jgi:hypothetical protein